MKRTLLTFVIATICMTAMAVGPSGMYQYSVALTNYISTETGKAPTAYLWVPEKCKHVKAVMFAQQNMTEETLFKMESFKRRLTEMDVALLWVAPWFSQKWDPATSCQSTFDDMMTAIAYQSGHLEIAKAPVIPFGHSAQATFPWNFAAWNPDRTLCIISFHGDAPRTNLCGFGTSNIDWGRQRNIDGIPGLMIEGEYEWWEARVRPALAFRMMYPESCVSFLCDTGRGHFDCGERTAEYIAKFIEKSIIHRLNADGTLRKVNPQDGWLAARYASDIPGSDGEDKGKSPVSATERPKAAPYNDYEGDPHDAFWYFDREMAELTERRYAESRGKKRQYVGFMVDGKIIPENPNSQTGMTLDWQPEADGITFKVKAVYTDSTHTALSDAHGKKRPYIEVISGPVKKIDDTTFRIYPYEAGWDNPRRALSVLLVAVGDADKDYRGCVQPISIRLPEDIINKIK